LDQLSSQAQRIVANMNAPSLTDVQIERVLSLVLIAEGWIDVPDDEDYSHLWGVFRNNLAKCTSPLELHCVAANLNWDNGLTGLLAVLDHPLCDQGTALLLYWLGEPAYSFSTDPAAVEEETAFLVDIQSRYLANGYPRSLIATDPANLLGEDCLANGSHPAIPEAMRLPSPGTPAEDLTVFVRILAAIAWFERGSIKPSELASYGRVDWASMVRPQHSRQLRALIQQIQMTQGAISAVQELRAFLIAALAGRDL